MREIIGPRKTILMIVRMTPQLHREILRAAWKEKVSAAEFMRRAATVRMAEATKRMEQKE